MINKLFKQHKRSNIDLETRLERLTWILEHITPETKHEMLIAVIIEISAVVPLYERKLIQKIIERCR